MAEQIEIKMPKTFKIRRSERCFRFKPDALMPHAPQKPGVYEFVIFDENVKPQVLYIGLALPGAGETIYKALGDHLMGNIRPSSEDLFKHAEKVYFDTIEGLDLNSLDDYKDIAAALIRDIKPKLNPSTESKSSGTYGDVTLQEVE